MDIEKLKYSILAIGLAWLLPIGLASAAISDVPLYLNNGVAPNVLLNMSVETPMGGAAYADQAGNPAGCGVGTYANPRPSVGGGDVGVCYIPVVEYLGYFNPKKCYAYASGRFSPGANANADHSCGGTARWSGNFLNWATMTAIDTYIWTMTGGHRVTDTTALTVLRRARKHHNDGWFPHKLIRAANNVAPSTVTPFGDAAIYIANTDYGFTMGTTRGGDQRGTFNVQVEVCRAGHLEANCKAYGGGAYHKPEGLIQKNAGKMRFALTSYTFDNADTRDGGVLRSNMKYVGPTVPTPLGNVVNAAREFGTDGLLINNPDGAGPGLNSGIINYINRFSEPGYKSYDPIGELYYESLRYFKNLGRTPEYSAGLTAAQHGGFMVQNNWQDPIQYSCQKNFIVGINDANPWLDKRLPGTFFTVGTPGTPGMPATFTANDFGPPSNPDGDINVTALTNRVGQLEGLNGANWLSTGNWTSGSASGVNDSVGFVAGLTTGMNNCNVAKVVPRLGEVMGTCGYAPKQNSYYISGLAFYANTEDLRPDMPGKQTVQTFLIDSQEYSPNPLDGNKNMLWLAGKYGGFVDSNNNNIPDLQTEWDADNDGLPDNYVLASQPDKMIAGLVKAFDLVDASLSTSSAAATSSSRLLGDTFLYKASFLNGKNGDWTGELQAFPLLTGGVEGPLAWSASSRIPAHATRNIRTWDGATGGVAFTDALVGSPSFPLTVDQVNYLRGNDSQEVRNGGIFRDRSSKLGDIINADPHHVHKENFGYSSLPEGGSYSAFVNGKASRTAVVYAAANDGMLHAFRASDGVELFAYVPQAVWPNLPLLTDPGYAHKYFVDGDPTAWDAHWGGSWKTVLVGSLGAGGKAVYALNVTNPTSFSVLWEFSGGDAAQQNNMGHIMGNATIARFPDGNYWAVFGNGYASVSGKSVLFMVRVDQPSTVRMIELGSGPNNGLSTPKLVDVNGDRIVDLIYAGDLRGNVWKIDTAGTSSGTWDSPYPSGVPLFQAQDSASNPQPITSAVEVGLASSGASGLMVYFGTGQYFETGDNVTTTEQSMYGIVDVDGNTGGVSGFFSSANHRSQLQAQTILVEGTIAGNRVRAMSDVAVNYGTQKGWVFDLYYPSAPLGERIVVAPLLFNGKLLLQTITPSISPCEFGGSSMLMLVDPFNGGRPETATFNADGIGGFDNGDMIDIGGGVMVFVSGLDSGVGISGGFPSPISEEGKAYVPVSGTIDQNLNTKDILEGDVVGMHFGNLKPRTSWRQIQ